MVNTIRILGIDPGLRRTGWGILDTRGSLLTFIASGTLKSDAKMDLADRLRVLYQGLEKVIATHGPHEAAIENTFVNKDASATLKLGQARGVAMVVPSLAGLSVCEYAPNAVKKAVIGVGHGDKTQIKMMVDMLLPKAVYDSDDAADALAIAICHSHHRSVKNLKIAVSA